MIIKILGSGCPNCQKLESLAGQAATELGLDAKIEKVTDFAQIAAYGAMAMPALVIDDQLKLAGRLPKLEELKNLLANA
ncbi:MAG: thioredoxin family protein [Patescibacteria group bacterium]|jgi:small redox-active disulfide protein 2|nr:thioredoxin family protein [Patescibacteria group bacterium]